MTIKHTKGHWKVSQFSWGTGPWEDNKGLTIDCITGEKPFDRIQICNCTPQKYRSDAEWDQAVIDAKLMAAAPSLLFALEWIVDICNRSDAFKEDLGAVVDSEYIINIAKRAIKLAEEGT
jgi:hypothetical protein